MPWDVLEIRPWRLRGAQGEGLLQPLDLSVVPEDQLEPGTVVTEGVAVELYTANVTWNTDKWPLDGTHPQGLADMFNTKDFPGKR